MEQIRNEGAHGDSGRAWGHARVKPANTKVPVVSTRTRTVQEASPPSLRGSWDNEANLVAAFSLRFAMLPIPVPKEGC